LLDAKHLSKPQLQFSSNLPRDRKAVFTPSLTSKPNATAPLDLIASSASGLYGSHQAYQFVAHPYGPEIREIPSSLSMDVFKPPPAPTPFPADSFEKTPFTFVNSDETFSELLQALSTAKEIAVDLEHHDYRTYHGLVCLLQISVPGQDFVVDPLVPEVRDRMGELNQTFTDPSIVKVFHGADRDIIWLQRDFGVYVVGLFDTFQASKLLGGLHWLLTSASNIHAFIPQDTHSTLWRLFCSSLSDSKQTSDIN
jgi:exosome complex exonuclease RRP6